MNFKTIISGAVVGILVFGGAYFLMSPAKAVQGGGCATFGNLVNLISHQNRVRDDIFARLDWLRLRVEEDRNRSYIGLEQRIKKAISRSVK